MRGPSRPALLAAALLLAGVAAASPVMTMPAPLFKQCDPAWAGEPMGNDAECAACGDRPATICEQGCAMSCVSMALNFLNFSLPVNGSSWASTPQTLNWWLREQNAYLCLGHDCNNLELTAPQGLSTSSQKIAFVSEQAKGSFSSLQFWMLRGNVAVAHVRNNTHFVLLTGWDSDFQQPAFYVNDPGFNQTVYEYSDISDVILYSYVPEV
jgi:hypothetical protein